MAKIAIRKAAFPFIHKAKIANNLSVKSKRLLSYQIFSQNQPLLKLYKNSKALILPKALVRNNP